MTPNEILDIFEQQFTFLFPDAASTPTGINWEQRSYREDLFRLSVKAFETVFRDDIKKRIEAWAVQREQPLRPEWKKQLAEIVEAWEQWQFAYRLLVDEAKAGS